MGNTHREPEAPAKLFQLRMALTAPQCSTKILSYQNPILEQIQFCPEYYEDFVYCYEDYDNGHCILLQFKEMSFKFYMSLRSHVICCFVNILVQLGL